MRYTTSCLAAGLALLTLSLPAPVFAQMGGGGGPVTVAASIKSGYAGVKRNLIEAAQAMPESDYGFKPNPDIRAFGQLFGHVANAQFLYCSAARGEENPNMGHNLEELTSKADIVKALQDSFTYCDAAYDALTDDNLQQMTTNPMGRGQIARGAILANNVVHNNEMYGTTAVYMRAHGMVPPSTARRGQRGG